MPNGPIWRGKKRLWLCLPAGAVGGILGGVLLLTTSEQAFHMLVPYLILLASGLLAVQEPLRRWLVGRAGHARTNPAAENWAAGPVALAAVYGGYFGAGLSVIVLAARGTYDRRFANPIECT